MLDGWRAFSILAVLAGHWLPLGPARWQWNEAVAAAGMAVFFCLSGFLITQSLYARPAAGPFLIRRVARILPLAWAGMLILALATDASGSTLLFNLLFLANLPPAHLMEGGQHLWSLCLEMQFYFFAALLVLCLRRAGLYAFPLICLFVTSLRIADGQTISIVTWHRADEILIGASLALALNHGLLRPFARLPRWLVPALIILLIAVSTPALGRAAYLRPYIAGLMVGVSLYTAPMWLEKLWTGRNARYIASISYALYVVHGILGHSILGGLQADRLTRYALRIPLALTTWAISHVSTRYYEAYFIALGKRMTSSGGERRA